MVDQRPVLRRFLGENVESRGLDLAALQSGQERGLIDDAASGGVDDHDPVLHLGEFGRAQYRLLRFGNVEGEDIGLGEQLVQRDLGDGEFRLNGDDVIRRDPHSEGDGPLGQGQADPAGPDQAEGLSIELRAVKGLFLPLVLLHGHVGPADLADRSQHEAEGVPGHGDGGGRRGVGDLDVFFLGRGRVDVVQADAGPDDDLQSGGGSITGRVILLALRTTTALNPGIVWMRPASSNPVLTTTSKPGTALSSSMDSLSRASAIRIFSCPILLRIGSAALMDSAGDDGIAQVGQGHLEGGQGRDDSRTRPYPRWASGRIHPCADPGRRRYTPYICSAWF